MDSSSTKNGEENKTIIKVGSRKSTLALIQTNGVIDNLKLLNEYKNFEIVEMTTLGDQILDKPLPKIGEKSLFTKELETALSERNVSFLVHSLKDLPTTLPDNLGIGAVCKREDARDAVMFHPKLKGRTLETLPAGSIIGTSSLRRLAQLHQKYPHLLIQSVRGNLNTRLAKLENSKIPANNLVVAPGYSALMLAVAGMERIGWKDKIGQILEPNELMYAVGQGALAIECRIDDDETLTMLSTLHDRVSTLRVVAERSLLKALGGGCSAPVAVHTVFDENILSLSAGVWSLDGKKHIIKHDSVVIEDEDEDDEPNEKRQKKSLSHKLFAGIIAGNLNENELKLAEELGEKIAKELQEAGAMEIMQEAREQNQELEEAEKRKKRLETIPGGELCIAARLTLSQSELQAKHKKPLKKP